MGFRNFLERLLEPQFDDVQFVTDYVPALEYKKTNLPIKYLFNIKEDTELNTYSVKNTYTQNLDVYFLFKGNKSYHFNIETSNYEFTLDKSLLQQKKLLEALSALTNKLEVIVSERGIITSINSEVIIKKWKKIKPILLERYQGNQAYAYIEGIGKKIEDENMILGDIKQVRLLGLLFGGYQLAYKKDTSINCKISNLIHCLPVFFKEKIREIKEDKDKQEKRFSIQGSMISMSQENKERIQKYFSYYKAGDSLLSLSNYKKEVVLDLKTGFPKNVSLDIELTNGKGYRRKQQYNLTQIDNG